MVSCLAKLEYFYENPILMKIILYKLTAIINRFKLFMIRFMSGINIIYLNHIADIYLKF